ncbi:hypothetical protein MAR_027754 [Mya arenaria]|uniref:Uncharacterized protein n=1 Tax=Mya arenaria TaxID=6604 RepID=A0ABY7EWU4_MYAAR|nr:hypothetical protein MAR_027754 [Mya arenaria]
MSPAQEQDNPLKKKLTFKQNTNAKFSNKKRGFNVQPVRVRTLEFQNSIRSLCKSRGDEWGNIVLGRLECLLMLNTIKHAVQVSGQGIRYRNSNRLKNMKRNNDTEPLTINDLVVQMELAKMHTVEAI